MQSGRSKAQITNIQQSKQAGQRHAGVMQALPRIWESLLGAKVREDAEEEQDGPVGEQDDGEDDGGDGVHPVGDVEVDVDWDVDGFQSDGEEHDADDGAVVVARIGSVLYTYTGRVGFARWEASVEWARKKERTCRSHTPRST